MIQPFDRTGLTVSRTVWISSLLLRVGITGAALAVWAVVSGVNAQTYVPVALFAAAAGVAIAVLSLRKAWRMLAADAADAAPMTAQQRSRAPAIPSLARAVQ